MSEFFGGQIYKAGGVLSNILPPCIGLTRTRIRRKFYGHTARCVHEKSYARSLEKSGKTPQRISQLPDLSVNKSRMKYRPGARAWSQTAAWRAPRAKIARSVARWL